MELTVQQISECVKRASAAMVDLEQQLNAADAKLGDGDTGSMLARVIGAMAAIDVEGTPTVSEAFAKFAKAGMSATGSSLGTLFAGALLSLSKQTKDRSVDWSELSDVLANARDGMIARGGAQLGDKTVLDALNAVVTALVGKQDSRQAREAVIPAVYRALEDFRTKPCRMGRAKFFSEKSVGLDDPGMLAFALLINAVTANNEA